MKRVIAYIFMPVPFSLALMAIGLALLLFTTRQRTGKVLVGVGFGVLLLFSNGIVSEAMLGSLESYAPLVDALYSDVPEADISTQVTFEDGRKGVIAARVKIRDMQVHPSAAPAMEKAA